MARTPRGRVAQERPPTTLCAARAIGGLVLLVLACWVTRTQAQTNAIDPSGGFDLVWEAPPGCAERGRTVSVMERLLGPASGWAASSPLRARASVSAGPNGKYRLALVIRRLDQSRTRELEAWTCEELADAAALTLAIAIDPDLGVVEPPSPNASLAPPPAPPAPTSPVPVTGAAPNPPPGPAPVGSGSSAAHAAMSPFIGMGAAAALGVMPHDPAFGFSMFGGFDDRWLRLGLAGTFLPAVRSPPHEGQFATFELETGSLFGCAMYDANRALKAGGCATSELGAFRAQGSGVRSPRTRGKLWGAAGLGALLLVLPSRDFGFGAQFDLLVPWGRPEFRLASLSVHRPNWIVGYARVAVEARFR